MKKLTTTGHRESSEVIKIFSIVIVWWQLHNYTYLVKSIELHTEKGFCLVGFLLCFKDFIYLTERDTVPGEAAFSPPSREPDSGRDPRTLGL